MGGVPLDLRAIETPAYLLSTREDHIAPWESTYAATRLYKGPVRFVLSGSGHVAGVINPPSRVRYGYWTCPETPADPEEFLARAQTHEGSWWLDWLSWLGSTSGPKEPARIPGKSPYPPLEPAPGRYALMQA
jgi:polyhydroxyalkanoate synthase